MLTITQAPAGSDAATATANDSDNTVTLDYGTSSLTLSTLPRPGNYFETVFVADGVLGFVPGAPAVIAAHLCINQTEPLLTLYPLTPVTPANSTHLI